MWIVLRKILIRYFIFYWFFLNNIKYIKEDSDPYEEEEWNAKDNRL